jgi:outer membrane protein assembly factor BamB
VFQFSSRFVRSSGLLLRLAVCGAAASLPQVCRAQDSVLVGDYSGSKIVKLAYPSGVAQTHFVGNGMTTLNGTEGMTFGPDGNLYFSSRLSNQIVRVDGRTGYPFGASPIFVTAGAGGLSSPFGLTFGPDGRLYVASYANHSVFRYDGTTGAFIDTFVVASAGTLTNPWGLVFNNGFLYVCSSGNGKVLRFDGTTGAFIDETIPAGTTGLTTPRGILFDPTGRMYVTGSNEIVVKDTNGTISVLCSSVTIPALNTPNMPTFTSDGASLLVPCQNGQVLKIDKQSGASQGTVVLNGAGGMSTILASVLVTSSPCYANCDGSTAQPVLNVADFTCFLQKFAAGCP